MEPESLEAIKTALEEKGYEVYLISAATRQGIDALLDRTSNLLDEIGEVEPIFDAEAQDGEKLYELKSEKGYNVYKDNEVFVVEGDFLEKLIASVNFEDFDSVSYFQKILKERGVFEELEKRGIEEGDTVRLLDIEFDYIK
jgi:GTP-binding protein